MKKKVIGLRKKNWNMSFSCHILRKNSLLETRKKGFAEYSKSCLTLLRPEPITNVVLIIKKWRKKDFKLTVSLKMWYQSIIPESTKNYTKGILLKLKIWTWRSTNNIKYETSIKMNPNTVPNPTSNL